MKKREESGVDIKNRGEASNAPSANNDVPLTHFLLALILSPIIARDRAKLTWGIVVLRLPPSDDRTHITYCCSLHFNGFGNTFFQIILMFFVSSSDRTHSRTQLAFVVAVVRGRHAPLLAPSSFFGNDACKPARSPRSSSPRRRNLQ